MSTTTMHFGPEWMRPKHQSVSRTQPPPSPPPSANPPAANASTYSALVSPAPPQMPEKHDEAHPFRYSKEEMLRIYKEGGGKGGLGLEVERWEGVVREIGTDPVGLREMGEAEKKLFAISVNSDLRRRQSNDYLSLNTQNLERPRLSHANTGSSTGSPLRERYGSMGLMPRRRDSTDQAPTIPRKLSLSGQAPLASPRDIGLPSPRRIGHGASFDGVLNGGDSWTARRRASEGHVKTVLNVTREPGGEDNEIREEEEEGRLETEPTVEAQDRSEPPANSDTGSMALQGSENIETGMAHLSVEPNSSQNAASSPSAAAAGPPPGLADLANVEWSYLDPQGQVQGPFRADLMQKWNDDGYFTPDLLMKRTTIDTEWISVAELARRTGGGKIFLSPIAPPMPPGLARHTDSPFGMAGDPSVFNNPYQPSPIRSIRSTTLDSYTGSNPSDSPASSFGGGRFGNGSPDPSAFGGRVGQFGAGDIGGGRVTGFGIAGDASPALGRRNTYGETAEYRSPGFNNVLPSRGATLDNGFGMNGAFTTAPGPWNTGANYDPLSGGRGSADSSNYQPGFGSNLVRNAPLGSNSFSDVSASNSPYRVNDFGYGTPGTQHGLSQDKLIGGFSRPMGGLMYNDLPAQSHPHPSSSQFVPSQQIPTAVPDIFDARAQSQLPANNGTESVSVSPWGALDPPIAKRPGPFDPPHPTSSNTTVLPPLQTQPSPWGNVTEPSPSVSQTIEPTPVQSVSESIEPDSAVTDNVAEEVAIIKDEVVIEIPAEPSPEPEIQASPDPSEQLVAAATAVPPPVAEAPPPAPPPSTKSKAKPTSQPPVQASSPVEPITATAQTSPQPAAAAAPKAAWAKDDDAKKAATSLRQIQDAEAKKAEARKAVERERERAARANANATEDIQSFTTSWGLPTSQAGKSSVTVPPKETSAAAAAPTPTQQSPPAVWTTAAKSTAARPKTMKEIQEEEERRKKTAAVKEAPAVRRPYAESTNRAPPPTQGNAWTTVGPSGKAMSTANAPPRPPVQPSASTANSTSTPRVNGAPPAARPATSAAKPPPSNVSKAEDFPLPPSNDFMRWLADNMKGLNNTVNVEEIMSMLLSFPLDPDPSTTEIISDLIYANSTTLDGRRFAADFVSKRKADAVARSKNGAAGASSAKPISIADVVKAQPKPQTSEWGGFKVVNKKKKGGRS